MVLRDFQDFKEFQEIQREDERNLQIISHDPTSSFGWISAMWRITLNK